jgi:hypothetical protein
MASRTSELTLRLIDDISKPARSVETALAEAEARIKSTAAAMGEGVEPTDRLINSLLRLKVSAGDIEAVSKSWTDYTRANKLAADSSDWTRAQSAAVRSWETSTIASIKSVMTERRNEARGMAQMFAEQNAAQKRALDEQLVLIERGMAEQGAVIGRANVERLKQQARADEEQTKKRREWLKGNGGMAAALGVSAAGATLAGASKTAIEAGAAEQHELVTMQAAGIPAAEIAAAKQQTIDLLAKYTNVQMSDALRVYKELRSVLLTADETPKLLPDVLRTKSALDALDPSGKSSEGLGFAVKGAEVLGLTQDPKRFKAYMDAMVRAQQVMGATVTPEAMYEIAKYEKSSGVGLSDRFKFTTALSLAQEMGGSTTGQSIDQFVKQLVGGFQGNNHSAAKEFVRLGLANEDDFETTKTGEIKGYKAGHHLATAKLAQSDPDLWVSQVLIPALQAHGITDESDQIAEVRRLFPAGRAADLVAKLITQAPNFAAHAEKYGAAQGSGTVIDNISQDPIASLNSLTDSMKNFGAVLTSPAMGLASKALSSFASDISGWAAGYANFAKVHPDIAAGIGAGLPAAGVAGGTYLLWQGLAGGFGLKGSAVALDKAAADLSAAALGIRGGGGSGPGPSPGMPSLRGKAALGAVGAAALMAGAPSDDATINEGLNDNSKTAVGQAVAASVDALKRLADDARAAMRGFEITRPAHVGGIGSDAVAAPVRSDDLDAAKSKADRLRSVIDSPMDLNVGTSSIDDALRKALQLRATLDSVNGAALGAASRIPTRLPPSSPLRGSGSRRESCPAHIRERRVSKH